MRNLLLLLAFTGLSYTGFAQQINNGGLEHWTNQLPDSFYTSDAIFPFGTVLPSTDKHSGTYSALLETKHDPTFNMDVAGRLVYASQDLIPKPWPFTYRPTKLKFWYKFSRQGTDTALANIVVRKYNSGPISTPVGQGQWITTTNTPTWTQAQITLLYAQVYNPDTIDLVFQNAYLHYTLGTKFWVDDITLEYSTGVEEPEQGILVKFYPNPSNGSFTTELPTREPFDMRVTDIAGKIVYTGNGFKNKTNINCKGWPNGMYIVTVSTATKSYTERLSLNQ
jgi:hypothetical protein